MPDYFGYDFSLLQTSTIMNREGASNYTQMFEGYFKYMGLDIQSLTDVELKKIQENLRKQDIHMDEWLSNQLGLERDNVTFQRMIEKWFNHDRFILYPELFKTHISKYLREELPNNVATYVRGMFTGNSEKITKQKITDTLNNLKSENPNWWHNPEWKRVFLERFSVMYPKSVDGRRRESTASIHPGSPPTLTKGNRKNGAQDKVITINLFTVIFWLVGITLFYLFIRWIF